MKRGDILLAVDDTVFVGDEPLLTVVKMLRGPVGTKIRLTLRREGTDSPLQVTPLRERKVENHAAERSQRKEELTSQPSQPR